MFIKDLGLSHIFQVSSVVRHPVVWSSMTCCVTYESVPTADGPVQLGGHAEVHQLHLGIVRQQHVLPLDVPVNHLGGGVAV